MARGNPKYDPTQKATPEWQSLYKRFGQNAKYRALFADFQQFYDWSMANGFVMGAKLVLMNDRKPYTIDNLRWEPPGERKPDLLCEEREEAIAKWNAIVNRIRIHYGLAPF